MRKAANLNMNCSATTSYNKLLSLPRMNKVLWTYRLLLRVPLFIRDM